MLRKIGVALFASCATALEFDRKLMQPEMDPLVFELIADEPAKLINAVGTYPCVFKIGTSFYDFTPFKIATQS